MTKSDVYDIVKYCHKELNTHEVVLLGGEPTLHKNFDEIIKTIFDNGINEIRIVTNGGKACERFIKRYSNNNKPKLVFSVDGSNNEIHDLIRGNGSFYQLINSINFAKKYAFDFDAIISICTLNLNDIISILNFLDFHGFGTVNIHYVSARGNATNEMQISPRDWLITRENVIKHVSNTNLSARFETTFITKDNVLTTVNECRVNNKNNLMFFPNGDVYLCGLFVGSSYKSGFTWNNGQLNRNISNSELSICSMGSVKGCPGMEFISASNELNSTTDNYVFSCIYDKELFFNTTKT